jgi:hypothetical protein
MDVFVLILFGFILGATAMAFFWNLSTKRRDGTLSVSKEDIKTIFGVEIDIDPEELQTRDRVVFDVRYE